MQPLSNNSLSHGIKTNNIPSQAGCFVLINSGQASGVQRNSRNAKFFGSRKGAKGKKAQKNCKDFLRLFAFSFALCVYFFVARAGFKKN
jgi:hypothetical protein